MRAPAFILFCCSSTVFCFPPTKYSTKLGDLDTRHLLDISLQSEADYQRANEIFKTNYGHAIIEITSFPNAEIYYVWKPTLEVLSIHYEAAEYFLKAFASSIQRLSVLFSDIPLVDQNHIAKLVNNYSCDTLTELHLKNCLDCIQADKQLPFKSVQTLFYDGDLKMISTRFRTLFPEMQNLHLTHSKDITDMKQPNLIGISVEKPISAEFAIFVKNNPQLQAIRLQDSSIKFMNSAKDLPELKILNLNVPTDMASNSGQTLQFHHVKEVTIRDVNSNIQFKRFEFKHLSKVDLLVNGNIENKWIELIGSNDDLSELVITSGHFDDNAVVDLSTKFPNLKGATIGCGSDVTIETIKSFLQSKRKLKEIVINFPLGSLFAAEDLKQELGQEWKVSSLKNKYISSLHLTKIHTPSTAKEDQIAVKEKPLSELSSDQAKSSEKAESHSDSDKSKKISLSKLINLSQRSEDDYQRANDLFKQSYGGVQITIVSSQILNEKRHIVNPTTSNIFLFFDSTKNFLKAFGNTIKRLSILFSGRNKHQDIVQFVNEYCSESLGQLHIRGNIDATLSVAQKPFKKVVNVLYHSTAAGNKFAFSRLFPAMRVWNVTCNDMLTNEFQPVGNLTTKYPNLGKAKIGCDTNVKIETIKNFLKSKHAMKSLVLDFPRGLELSIEDLTNTLRNEWKVDWDNDKFDSFRITKLDAPLGPSKIPTAAETWSQSTNKYSPADNLTPEPKKSEMDDKSIRKAFDGLTLTDALDFDLDDEESFNKAIQLFKKSFGHAKVEITFIPEHQTRVVVYDEKTEEVLVHYEFAEDFLKSFGKTIQKLSIAFNRIPGHMHRNIAIFANTYCNNLEEVYLKSCMDTTLVIMKNPFEKVHKVFYDGQVHMNSAIFDKLFPQMKQLHLTYSDRISNKKQPNLIEVNIEQPITAAFIEFLKNNSQIQALRVEDSPLKFLQVIQNFRKLQTLAFNVPTDLDSNARLALKIEHVKDLTIRDLSNKMRFGKVTFDHLSKFELMGAGEIDNQWTEIIGSNEDLNELIVSAGYFDEPTFTNLSNKFPNLVQAKIGCSKDINAESIRRVLYSKKNLQTIVLDFPQSCGFTSQDLTQLLQTNWRIDSSVENQYSITRLDNPLEPFNKKGPSDTKNENSSEPIKKDDLSEPKSPNNSKPDPKNTSDKASSKSSSEEEHLYDSDIIENPEQSNQKEPVKPIIVEKPTDFNSNESSSESSDEEIPSLPEKEENTLEVVNKDKESAPLKEHDTETSNGEKPSESTQSSSSTNEEQQSSLQNSNVSAQNSTHSDNSEPGSASFVVLSLNATIFAVAVFAANMLLVKNINIF